VKNSNGEGKGRGLRKRGGLINFFPLKRVGGRLIEERELF